MTPYLQLVNEMIQTQESYKEANEFLYSFGHGADVYVTTGDVSKFIGNIDKVHRTLDSGSLNRLYAIITTLKSFPVNYNAKHIQSIINTDLTVVIYKLMELSQEEDVTQLLKSVVTPLTALRRLTFIYGMIKLMKHIHELSNIGRSSPDKKNCAVQLTISKRHINNLIDIIKKLMLFHSEYIELSSLTKPAMAVTKPNTNTIKSKQVAPSSVNKGQQQNKYQGFTIDEKTEIQKKYMLNQLTSFINNLLPRITELKLKISNLKDQANVLHTVNSGDGEEEILEELSIAHRPISNTIKNIKSRKTTYESINTLLSSIKNINVGVGTGSNTRNIVFMPDKYNTKTIPVQMLIDDILKYYEKYENGFASSLISLKSTFQAFLSYQTIDTDNIRTLEATVKNIKEQAENMIIYLHYAK